MIPSKVSKVLSIVSPLVLLGALIGTLLAVNLPSEKDDRKETGNFVNGKAADFSFVSFSMHEAKQVSFEGNEGNTLIYFSDQIEEDKIQKTEEALKADARQKAYFLFPFSASTGEISQKILTTYSDSPIVFGHDEEASTILHSFTEESTFPYAVSIDKEGNIVSSSSSFDTAFTFFGIKDVTLGNEVGNIVPELGTHSYLSDSDFSLREACLGKITVINFWGTWCGPCVKELPYFGELKREYPDVEIVAVHSANPTEDVKEYLETAVDGDDVAWKDYGIDFVQDVKMSTGKTFYQSLLGDSSVYPYTFVLDKDQIIRTIHSGSIKYAELVSAITSL